MIASESAEDLLLGDRLATRALVEDIAHNRQIRYLAIADRHGDVIASTQADQVGGKLPARTGGGGDMLLIDQSIHYQSATVGELRLGISNAPLQVAQKTTLWVIVAVLLMTLVAVVGAAYWLSRRLLSMLDLLGDALLRVARGDFQHRIRLVRHDELGRLFAAFNLMNEALHARRRRFQKPAGSRLGDAAIQPTRLIAVPGREGDPSPSSG